MSVAYHHLNKDDLAKTYLDFAFNCFAEFCDNYNYKHAIISQMFLELAYNYQNLNEEQRAIDVCKCAINLSKSRKMINHIQTYYLIAGESSIQLKQKKQAQLYLKMAFLFCEFYNDQKTINKINRIKQMI